MIQVPVTVFRRCRIAAAAGLGAHAVPGHVWLCRMPVRVGGGCARYLNPNRRRVRRGPVVGSGLQGVGIQTFGDAFSVPVHVLSHRRAVAAAGKRFRYLYYHQTKRGERI